MREYNFRGQLDDDLDFYEIDLHLKKGEWVFGNLITNDGVPYIVGNIMDCDSDYIILEFWYPVIPESVGQCIGRKDINDINAYINDIVKYKNHSGNECIGIIKFGEYEQDGSGGEFRARKCLGYYIERIKIFPLDWEKDDEVWDPDYYKTISILETEVEIIGNIHDNPEMLEDKQ